MQHPTSQNEYELTVGTDGARVRIIIQPGNERSQREPAPHDDVALSQTSHAESPAKPKVSFYQSTRDGKRMRAAFVATQPLERRASLSAFICEAILREVQRLERQYNGGRQWPDVEAGQIPKGAPVRA
ncbi:hypothetical protein ABH924_004602 [Arthrobacter sp. GAS37]|uniref:ParB family protein n=1 Tax=Arthrobacter sp. GAS37 TaxID=3156261 RepID=UPI003837788F